MSIITLQRTLFLNKENLLSFFFTKTEIKPKSFS